MGRLLSIPIGVLTAALLAAGCGGGGGGGGGPQTLVVHPTVGRSGYVFEGGPAITDPTAVPFLGDNAANQGMCVVRSFDFLALPAGAQVVSAAFEDEIGFVTGTPFATLGDVGAVLTDVGGALDAGDYPGPGVSVFLGTFATGPSLGVRTVDVTATVALIAGDGGRRIDVLLSFDSDSDDDGVQDALQVRGLSTEHPRPRLTIVYAVP